MTRHWRAVQISVVIFAGWGSSLPAQSAVGYTPPASVARDSGSVSSSSVTEAAARLGITRAELAAARDAGDYASAGQTVRWILIAAALFLAGVVALILSNY